MTFLATIRGLPHNPLITEVNARSGPSTRYDSPFKAQVGTRNLPVLDVQPDENKIRFSDKLYQWFQLQFPDGARGWVRDDLLAVEGDGVRFGYDIEPPDTFAFALTRRDVLAPGQEVLRPLAAPTPAAAPAPTPAAVPPTPMPAPTPIGPPPAAPDVPPPAPATLNDPNRVRTAAFNITAGFEGSGYAAFQNQDAGIVSYGRFQFTLAGSGLFAVLQKYTGRTQSATANDLRTLFLERARNHDPNLRDDGRLRQLLIEAANDPIMQAAQDEAATELYWNVVQQLSVIPRHIRTPLGQALLFDMGINFGPRHGFLGAAEQELGVPPKSRLGDNGAREEDLIRIVARLRQRSHAQQAERDHLPGLKVRGDFWVALIQTGDWQLEGDPDGTLTVKPGVRVKVRNF